MGRRRKNLLALSIIGLVVLALAVVAEARRDNDKVKLIAGDLIIEGRGGFRPETLPLRHDALVPAAQTVASVRWTRRAEKSRRR